MSAPGDRAGAPPRTTVILSTHRPAPTSLPGLAVRSARTLCVWALAGLPIRHEPPPAEMVEGDWFDPVMRERLNTAAAERGMEVPVL